MDDTMDPFDQRPEPLSGAESGLPDAGGDATIPEPPFPPAPDVPAPPFPEAPADIWTSAPTPPPAAPSGTRRTLVIVAVAVAVLIAGGTAAVVATSRRSTSTSSTSPSPFPSASPVLFAPANLAANVQSLSVTLTWSSPAGGVEVERYSIYRDGSYLASVSSPGTSYTDDTVVPGKTYSYGVEATGGDLTSTRVSTSALDIPVPSLASARLRGDFNVVPKLVSKSGYTSYGDDFTLGWHFKPKCDTGACNVIWTDLNEKSFKDTFKRKGRTYSGSDTGDFNSVCGSKHHDSTLTIELKVTKARAIDGEWRARKLEGTIVQVDAAQLGCVTGRATLSFTATLLG